MKPSRMAEEQIIGNLREPEAGRKRRPVDLPLKFHPVAFRASAGAHMQDELQSTNDIPPRAFELCVALLCPKVLGAPSLEGPFSGLEGMRVQFL